MATIKWGTAGSAAIGLKLHIGEGLTPACHFTLTSDTGTEARIDLDYFEVLALVGGLLIDKRFKLNQKPGKADPALDDLMSALMNKIVP